MHVAVHVDDIIITENNLDGIAQLKKHLFASFQTKDLGKLRYFLVIEVGQSSAGIVISQRKYALDILSEAIMLDCKPFIPQWIKMLNFCLSREPFANPERYRRLVDKLNYHALTCPISYLP